jgi:YesN/AraC family two-component response regulator
MMKNEEAKIVIKTDEKHIPLPDTEKSRIIKELEMQMRQEEVFRQKQLSLTDLASLLQTNTSYLSRLINEHYGINFSNFLNGWRIREAQKMFTKNQHQSMTLEAIANAVGFQTRSTFNAAFKKISGLTPSVFIKNMEEIIKSRETV